LELIGHDLPVGTTFNKNYRVGKELRNLVIERDGSVCQKCKKKDDLQIDHIIPRAIGGKSIEQNLRCLCGSCNSSRPIMGDKLIQEIEESGYDFAKLCEINEIKAYAYTMRSVPQEEEEKEEEKAKELENGVSENPATPYAPIEVVNSPLSKMFKIWQTNFPNYPHDQKKDFPALRQIAEFLFKRQPSAIPFDELEKGFKEFCLKVKSNDFYHNKALSTISNKIQDILMASNNKPVGNVSFFGKGKRVKGEVFIV